jgi:uncharacterized membrane protein YebE (DUF533 family)
MTVHIDCPADADEKDIRAFVVEDAAKPEDLQELVGFAQTLKDEAQAELDFRNEHDRPRG